MEALKKLVFHDIIKVIMDNIDAGNISTVDGQKLIQMTKRLYDHIYGGYAEMEEYGVDDMMEEYLILDADIQEKRHKDELKALQEQLQREQVQMQELNDLTLWLVSQNRIDDLKQVLQDEAYKEKILNEYQERRK